VGISLTLNRKRVKNIALSLNSLYIFLKIFKESITNIRKKYEKINISYKKLLNKTVPLPQITTEVYLYVWTIRSIWIR